MSYGGGVNSSGNEIDFVSVDILDNHNSLFGQEMESQITDGFSENRFLEKEDVDTGSDNFLNEANNVFALFLKESVHGGVVGDDNIAL